MVSKNDDFLKKLLVTFRIEADEHLRAMAAGLLELEQLPADAPQANLIERVFREAHSLKGAARAVNLTEIESVCQALENIFSAMKSGQLALTRLLCDLMQEAIDALGTLLSVEGAATAVAGKSAVSTLIRRINDAFKSVTSSQDKPVAEAREAGDAAPASHAVAMTDMRPPPQPGTLSETVRVPTAKLGLVMRQAEELLSPKLAAQQRIGELREIGATLVAWKKERSKIQPLLRSVERSLGKSKAGNASGKNGGADGRQELVKLLEYLEAEHLSAKTLEGRVAAMKKSAEHDQRALAGMVDGLLYNVREMLMLPFSSLLEAFPRFIRDIARDHGKEIALVIQGGEIEIDRRILEELKDPLTHMLRNCVDHGIEKPEVRREKQKPAGGTITLTVAQKDGAKVEIAVADDGAGIDLEKVKASARRLGLVSAEGAEQLGEREALGLIFRSGVTTSPIVTDISGRGLGLAIVVEKAERLGGSVATETRPGAGTTFRLLVPLSLATFRGILVRLGDQLFVLPLRHVERALRVARQDIRTLENRAAITLGGEAVALVRLVDALALPRAASGDDGNAQVVVLGLDGVRIAFEVDEILGEQEVLVKMLGRQLARVRNVAGACVLGTGRVVPVLNAADLMKSAVQQAPAAPAPAAEPVEGMRQRAIMVVEDSITSRSLLKNILESAGYHVTTAVDGIDAYTALKTGPCDLVVSDVDMPRMNGFDLTAKIRTDNQLAELPVVLVTALESREHRERGIDVGANAYIVKSSFDQSNLLEIVGQLVGAAR